MMIGTTVGKYRIVGRLGRGGMGTVYRAVDETLDREVAIKVLNSEGADARLVARFRAEATTLARLNHPDIATIYEVYKTDADLLMVMELVRGETLDQLSVRCGPLPPERAAYLVAQILSGLSYAHRAGIVHRDLKPANVMVSESGTVKIMDFGIARVLGGEHLTSDGTMMGTPAYMAPEQVVGKEIDARADLYSAGVVFYRLLTGCLPFQSDTPIGMVQKQLWDPPTPVRTYREDLPDWCETVLMRALAKSPSDRFQTADEFRSALLSAIGHSTRGMDATGLGTFPVGPAGPGNVAPSSTPVPIGGQTPAEFAAAPTVTMMRHPTPAQTVSTPPPVVVASGAVQLTPPVPAPAEIRLPAPPAPASTAASQRGVASRRPPMRRAVLAASALALVLLAAGVVTMTVRRAGRATVPPATASSISPVGSEVTSVVTPPPEPALQMADATSAPNTADTAAAPGLTANSGVAIGTNGTGVRSTVPAAKPASSSGRSSRTAAPGPSPTTEPVVAATPVPAPEPPPAPEAAEDAAASAAAARMAALPPVIFSAQMVVTEGGKVRQRETNVRLAGGEVTVTGRDNTVISSFPLTAVVSLSYSESKQPMWNTPEGPAEITRLDGGAFGFLKGDQHWVSLRTDGAALILHVREQDSRRVIGALEERTGKKVERVVERK